MTAPLLVLGIGSLAGGWLNLPTFFAAGPVQWLHHWLEPVTGAPSLQITHGTAPHLPLSTEYVLVGIAVAIAVIGMVIAVMRLKPERLVPKAESPAAEGFERVLEEKYFVDEAYDAAIVRPLVGGSRSVLWKGMDAGIIDGLFVHGSAWLARGLGWIGSRLQSGQVGTYAWMLIIGVLGILGAFSLR